MSGAKIQPSSTLMKRGRRNRQGERMIDCALAPASFLPTPLALTFPARGGVEISTRLICICKSWLAGWTTQNRGAGHKRHFAQLVFAPISFHFCSFLFSGGEAVAKTKVIDHGGGGGGDLRGERTAAVFRRRLRPASTSSSPSELIPFVLAPRIMSLAAAFFAPTEHHLSNLVRAYAKVE